MCESVNYLKRLIRLHGYTGKKSRTTCESAVMSKIDLMFGKHAVHIAYSAKILFTLPTPPVRGCTQTIFFLFFEPKHMFWVLKRTVSMRRFF